MSTNTSTLIAAGVTTAYLRDLTRRLPSPERTPSVAEEILHPDVRRSRRDDHRAGGLDGHPTCAAAARRRRTWSVAA
jgi:hypothetical protein